MEKDPWWMKRWVPVAVVGVYVLAFFGYIGMVWRGPAEHAVAGQFGDSFGAFNAGVSGLAMLGVVAAIFLQRHQLTIQAEELRLQREELKATREELKMQREELARSAEAAERQAFAMGLSALTALHSGRGTMLGGNEWAEPMNNLSHRLRDEYYRLWDPDKH